MAVLFKEIKLFSASAASVLKEAEFQTDRDLRTLTREDLQELFPGNGKLKLRRSIFEIVHKEKPVTVLLGELSGFLSQGALRASLKSSGLLVDYLHILKELKTQMDNVQGFLQAHIAFLENLSKNPEQLCGKVPPNYPGPMSNSVPGAGAPVATVKCKRVVHGRTFGADKQLLDKVKGPGPGPSCPQLQLDESETDHQVIIVFCPISSRLEPDVKSAMSSVPGGIPVILVMMHHVREPKYTLENVNLDCDNVVLQVNVFFHDAKPGLLKCPQNDSAASAMQKKLLEYAQVVVVGESGASSHGKMNMLWPFVWSSR